MTARRRNLVIAVVLALLASLRWHATVAGVTVPVVAAVVIVAEAALIAVIAIGITRSVNAYTVRTR